MLFNGKIIFIAPLDWGLGHATRSVPVIRKLAKSNMVILGSTPLTASILDEEFPELRKIPLPAYNVSYSKSLPLWLKLGLDSPRIATVVAEEHRQLEKIMEELKPDVVISDNRFGLYTKKAHCIFITHQLFLKAPLFGAMMQHINKSYILNFDEVWVPDFEDEEKSLGGELSHGAHYHSNVKYIGPLSRLKDAETSLLQKRYDILVLLSGPEPLREELEKKLIEKLKGGNKKIAFVRGTTSENKIAHDPNMDVFGLADKAKLKGLITNSEKIICRSGYSTLMDLHLLDIDKKKLTLIPTPGQTEQEYLADYWRKKFGSQTTS